jgi:hypothetical protein
MTQLELAMLPVVQVVCFLRVTCCRCVMGFVCEPCGSRRPLPQHSLTGALSIFMLLPPCRPPVPWHPLLQPLRHFQGGQRLIQGATPAAAPGKHADLSK